MKKLYSNLRKRAFLFRGAVLNPRLTSVAIEINSFCNRKCRFCPNYSHHREKAFLEDDLFYDIIEQLKVRGFNGRLTFNHFNEPLLDKRLSQFIQHVRQELPVVHIYINTNGDLLSKDMWEKLRQAGLDFANITLYDEKSKKKIHKLLEELGPEEKKHIHAHALLEVSNRGGLVKGHGRKVKLPLKASCARPFQQLQVNYEGKVVLCCNDFFGQVVMGDLHKESIDTIWKNKIFRHYRKKLFLKNRVQLPLCDVCDMV